MHVSLAWIYTGATMASVAQVLALVPLQKFPIDFKVSLLSAPMYESVSVVMSFKLAENIA